MLVSQLKKLLSTISLLFALSVIVFLLRFATPQDPVEQSLGIFHQEDSQTTPYTKDQYTQEAIKLGLNKELFYFSIRPSYIPDQAYKLLIPSEKKTVMAFLKHGFEWKNIEAFLDLRNNYKNNLLLTQITTDLFNSGKTNLDYSNFSLVEKEVIENLTSQTVENFYYPILRWHGFENQYHSWITNFFSGKKIRSIQNNALVKPKIKRALIWTLAISFLSIFISYSLGIFIGFKRVSSQHSFWPKLQAILDYFFTMPFFWIATIAIVFFTTSDYGNWTNIFPSVHSLNFKGDKIFTEIFQNFEHLLLPIICISIHSIGFISSMMADNLKIQLAKPYILTAKQKGLSKNDILKNHGFKNAIFPILTMLTNSIPSAFTGSLIVEIIFNLPGIGRLLYNSILLADWNIVFPIVLMIGVITSLSYWLADILYAYFDPKIKTSSI